MKNKTKSYKVKTGTIGGCYGDVTVYGVVGKRGKLLKVFGPSALKADTTLFRSVAVKVCERLNRES